MRWQTVIAGMESARAGLADVEAERDDLISYLSTLRVVMGVLERSRTFDQTCQGIAEALVTELAAETCAIAVRDRPDEPFCLRGFASQSQRLGARERHSSITEATWLSAATLISLRRRLTWYRPAADGSLEEQADVGSEPGLLGLPLKIGGEYNGVIVLEYLVPPATCFMRGQALTLVADSIAGALMSARSRDHTGDVLADLEREVGAARDQLSKSRASLRHKEDSVTTLTQALIRSNQVRREFLGTLSHELRTPLNAILGYSEILREGLAGPVTVEQEGMLDRVMASTRNLNQLIDDMLFFVQLDSNATRVRTEVFSLGDLVDAVAAALPDRCRRNDPELRVEIGRGVETLRSDKVLLRRVLFHLIGNAFKFTRSGAVSLTATPWEERQGTAIVVRDTGVGMTEDQLEKIFEAFRQLDMSTTRRFEGVGLGLALVKRCLGLLNGTIEVASSPGQGTTFTVRIPETDTALESQPEVHSQVEAAR